MENISIIFSKATTKFPIFSWGIMLAQGTPYSHVAVLMTDDETGQQVIYQASSTMVNCMSLEEFLTKEQIVRKFDFQVDCTVKVAAKSFAISQLGKPYGVLSILGLALVILASKIGIKIHNPFKKAGSQYVCCMFAAAMLENADNIQIGIDLNDITPKNLYPVIEALPVVLKKGS